MKFCAVICEYNPFHNGHLYQLQEAKRLSGADAILCLMSGNFVQRGEAAIMNKYTRAKHAVMAGADVVIELPTIFATSNAELFAKGAISILTAIPSVATLCFGAENADAQRFISSAKLLNNEPKEISEKIKRFIADGMSYAKARAKAWEDVFPIDFLSLPNNILGIEYTRAILDKNANIEILPIARKGGHYNEMQLQENYSSATAIRFAIENKTDISTQVPSYVKFDTPIQLENKLDALEKYAILINSAKKIAQVSDCTEGLENAFKKAAIQNEELVKTLTSARYTSSRIRRIALQNLIKIEENLIKSSLQTSLYLRVLAIKKDFGGILSILSNSALPLIVRAHDEEVLTGVAKEAYQKDIFAEKIYNLLYPSTAKTNIFI